MKDSVFCPHSALRRSEKFLKNHAFFSRHNTNRLFFLMETPPCFPLCTNWISTHTMQINVILRWPVHDELLDASLSSQMSVFKSRPGHVIFMVTKVTLERVFSPSNSVFPYKSNSNIFPHTSSSSKLLLRDGQTGGARGPSNKKWRCWGYLGA